MNNNNNNNKIKENNETYSFMLRDLKEMLVVLLRLGSLELVARPDRSEDNSDVLYAVETEDKFPTGFYRRWNSLYHLLFLFIGTQYDAFAKFRACPCMDSFYRLDRFGPCNKCPSVGLTCENETVTLTKGFFWQWESPESRALYKKFIKELQVQSTAYDPNHTKYELFFPRVYACPVTSSCQGGMQSLCSKGYEGPLCAVCSNGYYQIVSRCQKCPKFRWLIGQIILAVFLLSMIMLPLIIGKNMRNSSGRSVTDIVLARFKIFIGFYQVTSGTLDAFSYVEWPQLLLQVGTFTKFLQLNLLQIAPLNCFADTLEVTAYTSFLFSVVLCCFVVVVSITYYNVWKLSLKNETMSAVEWKQKLSETKENCIRYVFLVLFILYPEITAQVLQMLPSSCQKICVDSHDKNCRSYLRSDYNLECYTDSHMKFVTLAYIVLSFVVLFPIVTVFLLWKNMRSMNLKQDEQNNGEGVNEVVRGLSFLYENYSAECWFWELLELVRKVVVTSLLVLIGGESRTSLGFAAIMSGLYTVLFAAYQPISDRFEHWLQLMSLVATSTNMNLGMLLKIPEESISSEVKTEIESTGISVLLIFVNLLVTGMIAGGCYVDMSTGIYCTRTSKLSYI